MKKLILFILLTASCGKTVKPPDVDSWIKENINHAKKTRKECTNAKIFTIWDNGMVSCDWIWDGPPPQSCIAINDEPPQCFTAGGKDRNHYGELADW